MIYVMMRYVNTLVSNGIIVITAFACIYMLVFIFRTNTEQMDGKGLSSLDCNNTMEQELKAKMFQKALDQTILSSSPYVVYPLPYLLSPKGQTCGVRSILPKEVYWSFRLLPSYRKNPVVSIQTL